jgi:Dolichyl-phosphate-mannose-protein mannosyltransferase
MFHVPLYIEGLRSRPGLVFWLAALAQATLWIAVPVLFYSAPPTELALALAVGREFPLAGDFGPPLAYWLAELVFRGAGLFGVYVLSQVCVVATYWCVFALGRAIVGATHAVMAVLLMAGIFVFVVPTPNFGPAVLAMPLWAAVLLFYWRAVGERRPHYWYAVAGAAALLLVTTDAAIILLGTLVLFTAMTERGRREADTFAGWIAAAVLVAMLFVHLFLLARGGFALAPALERLRSAGTAGANTAAWLRLLGALLIAHGGLAVLVVLASGWPQSRFSPAPAIVRMPAAPFAATFVKALALVPALLATIIAVLVEGRAPIGGAAPLLVLSGLAVVVAAGDSVELHHQRMLGFAWAGLLVVPAVFVPIMIAVLPWATATELKVSQPAGAMGQFFADSFARRTGRPLAVVGGDARIAELVALAAPSRPGVYFDARPEHSPRITAQVIRENGAVIVWPAADTDPAPPPDIKARFPDLVPEVPRSFRRPVRGRLPPLLIGWGVIRPANAPAAAPAALH